MAATLRSAAPAATTRRSVSAKAASRPLWAPGKSPRTDCARSAPSLRACAGVRREREMLFSKKKRKKKRKNHSFPAASFRRRRLLLLQEGVDPPRPVFFFPQFFYSGALARSPLSSIRRGMSSWIRKSMRRAEKKRDEGVRGAVEWLQRLHLFFLRKDLSIKDAHDFFFSSLAFSFSLSLSLAFPIPPDETRKNNLLDEQASRLPRTSTARSRETADSTQSASGLTPRRSRG